MISPQAPQFNPARETARAQAQALRLRGMEFHAKGDQQTALDLLLQARAIAPEAPIIHLNLGQTYERLNQTDAATRAYFLAVTKARRQGLWLDEASVAPSILPNVLHAMQFVAHHRDEVLLRLLEPHETRFGVSNLVRVRRALDVYLERDLSKPASAQQRPLFMYVPGLTETPYLAKERFDWVEKALTAQPEIAAEAKAVLSVPAELESFLQIENPAELGNYLGGSNASPRWDAYFFYRHGRAYAEHLSACPATANFLQDFPKVHIESHAPEICFSVLAPGTHILPHTGVTNSRVVAHLPLLLPKQCALKVADVERAWRMNEVLIFDDTFEHEAWNNSTQPRVILLMDTWHPDLSEPEQIALAALVEGIGVFNRGEAASEPAH